MTDKIIQRIINWEDRNNAEDGTSIEEKLVLYSTIRHEKPDSILEVGVSAGGATMWLAAALRANGGGSLTSVDNWSRDDGGLATGPKKALNRLQDLDLAGWVEFIGEDSHDYLPSQKQDAFDVAWIDGDHSYEGGKSDLTEAIRIASELVIFHDATHLPGPKKIIKERDDGLLLPGIRGFYLVNPDLNGKLEEL